MCLMMNFDLPTTEEAVVAYEHMLHLLVLLNQLNWRV